MSAAKHVQSARAMMLTAEMSGCMCACMSALCREYIDQLETVMAVQGEQSNGIDETQCYQAFCLSALSQLWVRYMCHSKTEHLSHA